MSDSQTTILNKATALQGLFTRLGTVPGVSAAEVTAHQALIDASLTDEQDVATAETGFGTQSVRTTTGWKELFNLCARIEDIAESKAPDDAVRIKIGDLAPSGGFNETRARKRAEGLIAYLGEFPETFTALEMTKAQLIADLEARLAATRQKAVKKVALTGAQSDVRADIQAVQKETQRLLKILRASFDKGSPELDTINRTMKRPKATKKFTEQPEPNP